MNDIIYQIKEEWPDTICHKLLQNAFEHMDKVIYTILGRTIDDKQDYTYRDVLDRVENIVAHFQNSVHESDKVLLICNLDIECISNFFGCLFSNKIVVLAKIPEGAEEFENLKLVIENADIDYILTTSKYAQYIDGGLKNTGIEKTILVSDEFLSEKVDLTEVVKGVHAQDIALLQYSSGTTSSPKGVMLSHHNIMESERVTILHFGFNEQSKIVSWLPLFHSLGMISNLIHPISADIPGILMPTELFIKDPISWFKAISKYSATISGAPNFAFDLCRDRIQIEDCEEIDLSTWEIAYCGSEAVHSETMKGFVEKFAKLGVRKNIMCPTYGLTECTLVVTANVTDKEPNRMKLAGQENGVEYVSCGTVVDGQILKIVDSEKKVECENGQVGEIWVSGDIVSQGYYRNEKASLEAFGNKILNDDVTYFATGDMGFLQDGELYIAGRKKNMLVVNGKNYYYEDIEQWIESAFYKRLNGECIVFSGQNDKKIVVVQGVSGVSKPEQYYNDMIERIAQKYSIEIEEIVFVNREELPKTASGKKKNQHCKELYYNNELQLIRRVKTEEVYKGQTGGVELGSFVQKIMSVINMKTVVNAEQWEQPLYVLGIDSISSLQIQNYLLSTYNVSLSLLEIRKMSLKGLYEQLPEKKNEMDTDVTVYQNQVEIFPLNDLQKAYVLGRNGEYELSKIATHVYFEFESRELETERLAQSFQKLVERHAMLRDYIIDDESQKTVLFQELKMPVTVCDISDYDEQEEERVIESTRRTLSHKVYAITQAPYFDLVLLKKKKGVQICLSIDLLIADARSVFILMDDWKKIYNGEKLVEFRYSFGQYIQDGLKHVGDLEYQRADKYWNEKVCDLPDFPRLPVKRKKTDEITFHRMTRELPEKVWTDLQQKSRQYNVSLPTVLLTAYAQILSIWSNMDQLSINVTNLERKPYHEDVERLIGQFASFIILDVDLSKKCPFLELADCVQENMWKALDHRQIGGTQILQKIRRKTGRYIEAIMPVVFTCVLEDVQQFEWLGELECSISQTSQVWLDNQIYVRNGKLLIEWDYVSELFHEFMIDEMIAAYCAILEKLAEDQHAWEEYSTRKLPDSLLEKRRIVNETQYENCFTSVYLEFEKSAKLYPERTALIFENEKMSYRDLKRYSDRIASLLCENGRCICRNSRVAIIMEKGWEQIVAVLGIMAVGCAYVPIDANLPEERIAFILDDAEIETVLMQNHNIKRDGWAQKRKMIDVTSELVNCNEEVLDTFEKKLGDVAYIIYTSGSTGVPKGAMIGHKGLANAIESTINEFKIKETDSCINITNLHHDMSVFDIFGMLCVGGCVIVPNEWQRKNPEDLAKFICDYQVTIWNSVPSIMDVYVEYLEYNQDQIPGSLRMAMLGGDWLSLKVCTKLFELVKGIQLVSVGGPTETTLWNIWNPFKQVESEWNSVPYGVPISNTKYYVMNERLEDCPTMVPGFICCSGVGVTKGYIKDNGKFAKHFAKHPETGEVLFISGDRGRYMSDGKIEFLGREDGQIKINGLRIELGEIEQVIKGLVNINDAKVLLKNVDEEKKCLVAYITGEDEIDENRIVRELEKKMPQYMIPAKFVVLDEMPVTRNQKIDVAFLEKLSVDMPNKDKKQTEEISGGIQEQIMEVVCKVLKVDYVDQNTELSKLGANSLELIRIINSLEKKMNYRIGIEEFFENPTVHLLADFYSKRLSEKKGYNSVSTGNDRIDSIIKGYTVIDRRVDREKFKRERVGIRKFVSEKNSIELMRTDKDSEEYRRIQQRKSHRYFSQEMISFNEFSRLLYNLSDISENDIPNYLYASGGGSYSIQIYLYIKENRIEGMKQGVYYYHPKRHRLFSITDGGVVTNEIHWTSNKEIFDQSAFSIFFVSQYSAIGPMYGEQGYDFLRIEVGEMSQILELYGHESNIGFCQIGNTDFARVRELFDLDSNHIYLHAMLGGKLLDEATEKEFDTYNKEFEKELTQGTKFKNTVELQKYAQLDTEMKERIQKNCVNECEGDKKILLTGATGFLGSHIVYDLLKNETSEIYCLVRASSEQEAKSRLLNSLDKWNVSISKDYERRIHAIAGDVGKNLLGLDEETYHDLSEKINVVVHNAAWVNWIAGLEELMPINVEGTKRIIEFCSSQKGKKLLYVSSLSVFPFDGRQYCETDSLDHGCDLYGAYAQSKWIAEKIVMSAKECGMPVTIVRPNLITGHSHNYVFNQNSFLENLIKSFIQLGYAPDTKAEIDMVPVDYVSNVIFAIVEKGGMFGEIYNIANPHTISFRRLIEEINHNGYAVKQIEFAKWKNKLLNSTDFDSNAMFPFWTYIYSVEEGQILMGQYLCDNTLELKNVECEPVENLVGQYLKYYKKIGFITT